MSISARRRQETLDALRHGTVPRAGLDALAVGLERFEGALDAELQHVSAGSAVFKAVRGEYGSGKTFLTRWLAERAKQRGFATSEVQISETETPLHRLETVYRRLVERLSTASIASGALRTAIDSWFFALEEDVIASGNVNVGDQEAVSEAASDLAEKRLGAITREAPLFAAILRGYRDALREGDHATADGLLAWMGGQPNVAASVKRKAGLKGDLDHFGALSFLQALLVVLRDAGHPGLLLVMDEVETLQRVRSDVRDRGLNALRQLIDELDSGRFPGLYLLITGTPAFFDGPQGVRRSEALASRLATDFTTDSRYDNPRAVQIRLTGLNFDSLVEVGVKVRDIYADGSQAEARLRRLCDDAYIELLAREVSGSLGGKVGVAPRLFLKKLVSDVLDRIDQFEDFDPRVDYSLTVMDADLTKEERAVRMPASVDDVDLDLT